MCTCVEVVVLCGGKTFMHAMHNILTIHIVCILDNMHYSCDGKQLTKQSSLSC